MRNLILPPADSPQRDGLTIEEARIMLGVARTTVYALIRQGKVEHFHVGRLCRVRRASVEKFMSSHTHQRRRSPAQAAYSTESAATSRVQG